MRGLCYFLLLFSFSFALKASSGGEGVSERSFYFVRHGSTDWSISSLLEGPQDLPLNDRGIRHVEKIASVFKSLEGIESCGIFCSKLRRCKETATILSDKLGLAYTEVDGIEEVYRGDWRQLDDEKKREVSGVLKEKDYLKLETFKVPDAEDWSAFLERIQRAVTGLVAEQSLIIVTHGQVVKEFLKKTLGSDVWGSLSVRWGGEERMPIKVLYSRGQEGVVWGPATVLQLKDGEVDER